MEPIIKEAQSKKNSTQKLRAKPQTQTETEDTSKGDTTKEDTTKEDTTKEDTTKDDTTKDDTTKDDTAKEDTPKEDTPKGDTSKEETSKENTTKEATTKEDASKYVASPKTRVFTKYLLQEMKRVQSKRKAINWNSSNAIPHSSKAFEHSIEKEVATNVLTNSTNEQNKPNELLINKSKLNLSEINTNKNNNNDPTELQINGAELLCVVYNKDPIKPEVGYTHDDLIDFLSKSTIKDLFPFASDTKDTIELLEKIQEAIEKLEAVELIQLIDLYHLCIMMHTYQCLETLSMFHRIELLNAVCGLSYSLDQDILETVGHYLCEKFVIGAGTERMNRVFKMQKCLPILINYNEFNRVIAMAALFATFAKIAGTTVIKEEKNISQRAFKMVKLVDWTQLIADGNFEDIFALVRSFSVIINTQRKGFATENSDKELEIDIHTFFMEILRAIRSSGNYTPFAKQVDRFIAFCIIRGSTSRLNILNSH